MSTQPVPRRSTEELLASVRDNGAVIAEAEVDRMQDIRDWALANTVDPDSGEEATIYAGRDDTGLPIAGPGAPLVSEYALMELCALLGRSAGSGRDWVGKILETCFRLPGIWDGVTAGRVQPWRALAIADKTRPLPEPAASFVDRQLREFAATCTWAQVDRLVEEALARFDPQKAEQQRREAAEQRKFDIHTNQVSFDGTIHVDAELDLADALDLDTALARRAKQLGQLGCEETLDVRRSMAAGDLARHHLTLDYNTGSEADGEPVVSRLAGARTSTTGGDTVVEVRGAPATSLETTTDHTVVEVRGAPATSLETTTNDADPGTFRRKTPGRKVELFVHLTDTVLNSKDGEDGVARCGNTQTPISPEQVKQWCAAPGTSVIVRPVIDLAGHEPIDAYEIPTRVRRQVELRDQRCRFPHCTRPAVACDLDHVTAYADGGATCACNLAPACRSHHRAKTFASWRYVVLDPGTYLWTSPAGYQYLVDNRGTRDLSRAADPPEH